MELIRAKMFLDGFKAAGLSAHEAEVSYLRKMNFSETDVRFSNELRYYRNGIVYYGKSMNAEYVNMVLKFLNEKYSHLINIANPKKPPSFRIAIAVPKNISKNPA